jgi:hypothetical protein
MFANSGPFSFFLFSIFLFHLQMLSETYSCLLRLKSSPEDDAIRMQPGSGDTHVLYVLFLCLFFVFLNFLEKETDNSTAFQIV